jgi:hypothetical protein
LPRYFSENAETINQDNNLKT